MKSLLQKVYNKQHLTQQEANQIFDRLINGELSQIEMTALLVALKLKGEKPQEIAGAAQALRSNSVPFPNTNYPTADSCGTGGSGMNTVNISTMVAFVLAELGVSMVKHGNRSISSKCGSADVLEQLGVKIDMSPAQAKTCLDKTNFCFLFAPSYHPGVGNVMPVRNTLQTRTIFNSLGPLINPAAPEFQLMGVYSPALCLPAAESLRLSGCQAAMIVHSEGYDEITLHNQTHVVELCDDKIENYCLTHADFKLPACSEQDIKGGQPEDNKKIFENILKGRTDNSKSKAIANTVAANAAALLKITGTINNLAEGAQKALSVIASGLAYERLASVVSYSKQCSKQASKQVENNTVNDRETNNDD